MSEKKLRIGISAGDINGIGLEVVLKTLSDNRILDLCIPVIYGSSKAISYHRKALNMENLHLHIAPEISKLNPKITNIINCWQEEINITFGEATDEAGKYSLTALDQAADDLIAGNIDGLVTAPVNKHNINNVLPGFAGQTEFLAQKCNSTSLMFLVSDSLKVGLVTNHIPVQDIASTLNIELIVEKLKLMNHSLQQDFMINKPRIAVFGLNPHAGDKGAIGKEEIDVIIPAIKKANEINILAFGPYPADGFFGSDSYQNFDAILAMYHDQGLVPFKALSFGNGVNFTAGLPVVRTSPDHGTAFEIAGKNIASEESFRKALFLTIDVIRNRATFDDMRKNPLKKTELSREIN